jgi:hypothetical protein
MMSSVSKPVTADETLWKRIRRRILIGGIVCLILLPLYFLAGTLIVRSGLLNYHGGNLDPRQFSAVWALIGTLFASGISLLGIVATHLHQQRTHQLAEETEKRLQLDSVAKGLELLSDGNGYSSKATVAGGLATVVRLGQASVAITVLRTVWRDNAVDPSIACWITDRVIESGNPSDIIVASTIMFENSKQLVQRSEDGGLIIVLPDSIDDNWDPCWPQTAKTSMVGALARAQMAVPPEAWVGGNPVILRSLLKASEDPDTYIATTAAKVLKAFVPTAEELAPLFGTDRDHAMSEAAARYPKLTETANGRDYFPRITTFIEEIQRWKASQQ